MFFAVAAAGDSKAMHGMKTKQGCCRILFFFFWEGGGVLFFCGHVTVMFFVFSGEKHFPDALDGFRAFSLDVS